MNNKIEIFDNFLPTPQFEFVKNELLKGTFPWYLNKILKPEEIINDDYNFQFCHVFYAFYKPQSEYIDFISTLVDKLDPLTILKIKANITCKTSSIIEHGYHTDYPDEVSCTTGVFYVNTTDGYTKFSTGEVVEGIENRLVLFPSHLRHTGTTCTDNPVRCVINFNFISKKTKKS